MCIFNCDVELKYMRLSTSLSYMRYPGMSYEIIEGMAKSARKYVHECRTEPSTNLLLQDLSGTQITSVYNKYVHLQCDCVGPQFPINIFFSVVFIELAVM